MVIILVLQKNSHFCVSEKQSWGVKTTVFENKWGFRPFFFLPFSIGDVD